MTVAPDHRLDPDGWARALGVSREAIDLYLASDVVDLHVDTFIWTRIFGYDLTRRHGAGLLGASFYGHADLPRLREAQVSGAVWIVTTNPLRRAARRATTLAGNLRRLQGILGARDDVALVSSAADYRAARAAGRHAAWIGVQGGTAFDGDPDAVARAAGAVVLVTIVHLTSSHLGRTSAPGGGDGPLADDGRALVAELNRHRILMDLAHINRRGFFDALAVHDRSQPAVVSHTGVTGVHPHWRNVDDEQLRAIADLGGTIGIIYEPTFLGDPKWRGRAARIVDHLRHVVETVGDDFASLGSDWDGAIVTPRDMPTCLELPRLVQLMLERGFTAERIGKILGGNWLRVVAHTRG